jgi:hypothetical protein
MWMSVQRGARTSIHTCLVCILEWRQGERRAWNVTRAGLGRQYGVFLAEICLNLCYLAESGGIHRYELVLIIVNFVGRVTRLLRNYVDLP